MERVWSVSMLVYIDVALAVKNVEFLFELKGILQVDWELKAD
jgi:hypothetical protein